MFLDEDLVSLKLNRVCKGIISVALIAVITLCFTFNAFAIDMPSMENNPQIVIDGKDTEFAWAESSRVSFAVSPKIANMASVEVLNYKNTVYGFINLTDVVESETDLIVRVDFYHQNSSSYVVFIMKSKSVLYGDDDFSVEGMSDINVAGYCVEFSFSTKSSSLKQGDLVRLEVRYGSIEDVDDCDTVQGFAERTVYDYYIGGESTESVSTESVSSGNSGSSGKTQKTSDYTKTTANSSTETTESTSFDVNEFVNYGYTDARETTVIISVMTVACFVAVVVMCVLRRTNENQKPNYTDDDKGCD